MEYSTDPKDNVGKPYRRGMLPYGGAVNSHGIITMVISEDENRRDVERLKSIFLFPFITLPLQRYR
jgi:hypothetical protein